MKFGVALLLAASLLLLTGWRKEPPVPGQFPASRAERFGVYNWNVDDRAFPAGDLDRLNWGADSVAETGSRTIRVFIGPRDVYSVNPPGVTDLADLAASTAYDRLFRDTRFTTYLLTAYSLADMRNNWADGFTPSEYASERDEIKRLSEYLLTNPAFAGKTFIILNWEGDNPMFRLSHKQSIWDAFTAWIESRADGVRAARDAVPQSTARVYSGLEFTLIRSPRTGEQCGAPAADPVHANPLRNRCVIDYVAPRVSVDYYSYSAWQTIRRIYDEPGLGVADAFKSDLRIALDLVRAARSEITEANFLIGEYGFERITFGECRAAEMFTEFVDALEGPDALGISYAVYWQIIDNFPIYGLIDDRFGLFRTRNGALEPTRLGMTYQRFLASIPEPETVACPRILRPPPEWGVVDADTGQPSFHLHPDSRLAITAESPFSVSGNSVHVAQLLEELSLNAADTPAFTESETRITAPLPAGRRPGEAWVYVTDANGVDSNAQMAVLACSACPQINAECGVLDADFLTEGVLPGRAVSIFGAFSPSGNRVFIEQRLPGRLKRTIEIEKDSDWSESANRINLRIPTGLESDRDAILYVTDSEGRSSPGRPIFIGVECGECAPVLRACRAVLNGEGEEFFPGSVATIRGWFPSANNRVVVEQWDANGDLSRHVLAANGEGGEESINRISVTLPIQTWSGRAIIYVVDSEGRESEAREITIRGRVNAIVSAASFQPASARSQILAAFGVGIASTTELPAADGPLPAELGGVRIQVLDRLGSLYDAPLFFVSPQQINFLMPAEAALGQAIIVIHNGPQLIYNQLIELTRIDPGMFAANFDGAGPAAAYYVRVKPDNRQSIEPAVTFDETSGRYIAAPVDFGPEGDELFLILFGTGLRGRSDQRAVSVSVGGLPAEVTYADAQPTFAGLDQVNVWLPRSLAGRGDVDVEVTADGKAANKVRVRF
ncbi:MAG: hypothetical protein KF868_11475 [Acidobacteria bacterium]|nr:hypothetical protein [Acidobacteriota bacterium]